MTEERYNQLMTNENVEITDEEFNNGWHFCIDWDGYLIGPGTNEMQFCKCKGVNKKKHIELFKTMPVQGIIEGWSD